VEKRITVSDVTHPSALEVPTEGAEFATGRLRLLGVVITVALVAVALPALLWAQAAAPAKVALSNLINAMTAAKAVYTQAGVYPTPPSSAAAQLSMVQPQLSFTTGPVTFGKAPHNEISVTVGNSGMVLLLANQLADGNCAYAEDNEYSWGSLSTDGLAGVTYVGGIHFAMSPTPQVQCSASDRPADLNWALWVTPLQSQLDLLWWTSGGQYVPNHSFQTTDQLISFFGQYVKTMELHRGPVDYSASPPLPVSVVVSTDGQIALYALPRPEGHCVYLETNENPANHPSSSGLVGATSQSGDSFAVSPRSEPHCSASAPAAGIVWTTNPPGP
jgi:hypothetical protein